MGRTPSVFRTLVLLFCGLRTGLCAATVESTDPEPGSFIDDFEGALNISLFCDIRDEFRLQTVWSIQTAEDVEMGDGAGPIDPSRFVLSGDVIMPEGVTIRLNTNLTLLELTPDLDQAIIFCGASDDPLLVSFTLRTYKPPVLNDAGVIAKRENEEFSLDLSEGNRSAFPFPSSFTWSRDRGGELVNETGQREYNYPSVFIRSVQPSDSGNYTLTATNHLPDGITVVGTDTGSFSLNVLFGARLSRGDESAAVSEGGTVTLMCGTDLRGNPTPQIEWRDSSGSPITDGGRFTVLSSEQIVSLTIANTGPQDSGNWTCTAQVFQSGTTEVGDAVEYSIRLVVVVVPTAPEDLQTDELGSSWISFSWQQSMTGRGNPELSRHIILVSGGGEMRNITVESNEPNTNVTGLLPGTEYTFRVVAVSVYGDVSAESPPSNPLTATTDVSVPAPECTAVPAVEDTRLVVKWSYIHTGGLPITAVDVQFQQDAASDRISFSDVDSSEVEGSGEMVEDGEASIPLPQAGIRYRFYVTATNSKGDTTTSCPDLLLPTGKPARPNPPVVVPGDSTAVVTVSTDHSGVRSSQDNFKFVLQITDQEDIEGTPIEIEDAVSCSTNGGKCESTITLTLERLTAGRLYLVNVRARNRYGESESTGGSAFRIGRNGGTDTSAGGSDSSMAAQIVGGVIGALVIVALVVLIIILAVYILFKLRSKSLSDAEKKGEHTYEYIDLQGKHELPIEGRTDVTQSGSESLPVHLNVAYLTVQRPQTNEEPAS